MPRKIVKVNKTKKKRDRATAPDEKYTDDVYQFSKLRKIYNACTSDTRLVSSNMSKQITNGKVTAISSFKKIYLDEDETLEDITERNKTTLHRIPYSSYTAKLFLTELHRMLRCYDSSVVQLQLYSVCPLLIKAVHEELLNITNIVTAHGTQHISECLPHSKETSIIVHKVINGTIHNEENKKQAFQGIPADPRKRKLSGVHCLFINAATEKDLYCAAHVCMNASIQNPTKISMNIAKLVSSMILPCHIPIHNTYAEYIFKNDYAQSHI
ncbi:putative glycoprotein [Suid betaherpesvirus 2]|uniref:Putative glycoprotein n=1 Tax=Suid betaherpesvirus 2 TaxID=1608255 RepID=U3GS61_9BETA|nr:putative glycoprotein [Suid betaherpesvirus 2]AGT99274.1 putative glycoprotein [Suid betaherpesvirus 2]